MARAKKRQAFPALLIVGTIMLIAALVGALLLQPPVSIPVLVYHQISDAPQKATYVVDVMLLNKEFTYLTDHGYTALTFDEAAADIDAGTLPRKPIILSFDDAYQGQYDFAFPLLAAYHLHATFFPPSDWVETPGHLTWDELRTLRSAGMEIGGHSRTHPYLFGLTDDELRDQIVGDKALLEQMLGTRVATFAYPYGNFDTHILQVVTDAGYRASRISDPAAVKRVGNHEIFGAAVMTNSFESFLIALH